MKASLFPLVFTVLGLVIVWTVPDASAALSQKFREQLQKQYESGYIPDPKKNMSYEERLAIRKKQQLLEAEKLKQQQQSQQPSSQPPPPQYWQEDRSDYREHHRRDFHGDPYERTYRYCEGVARPGGRDFRDCMRVNIDMMERRELDLDRYDEDRPYFYDRYNY